MTPNPSARSSPVAIFILSAVTLAFAGPAAGAALSPGQEPPAKAARVEAAKFEVKMTVSRIKMDGVIDEPGWQAVPVIPLPFEWTPGDNIPAPVKTDCLVTYDLHNLYVAFRCYDPEPGRIRAHLMDRDDTDSLILDDHISIMVDAFNDERRGFQFRANPLGVQADAIFSELEGYEDFSWDAIWDAAGRIEDWGWALEIAIPLNQLRFRKTDGPQTWGFSAERSWPRDVRHRITSHVRSRNVACIMCQFNKLSGFEGIVPSRSIELDPTLTGSRTDAMDMAEFPAGKLRAGKADFEPGITAKWGLTPNLILNATANPDFSQVEADVAQLEINRRFALFYPEKRPFFLEGADFFLTPIQAVFTRTVVDPAWGAKMTGKLGRTALGFFAAQDETMNLVFPSNQGSFADAFDRRVYGGVFRLRQDVGRASTLGLLYTGRGGEDYANHVGGVDGFLRFDDKNNVTFQYLASTTEYPAAIAGPYGQKEGRFGGSALNIGYTHFSRFWIIQALYEDMSKGFRADYGYLPRVDTRNIGAVVFRQIWGKPKGWFNLIRVGAMGQAVYDQDGTLTDGGLTLRGFYQGPLETQVNLSWNAMRIRYAGQDFDGTNADFDALVRPFSGSEFGLTGTVGQWVDYENVRLADLVSLAPRAALNLGRHLNLVLSHSFERLAREGRTIYTANLSQAKIVYNFSVRAFLRAILQYRDFARQADMYVFPVEPRTKGLFTQFLFSYKLNPRTVLFLGYSDNSLGLEHVDITRTNRTFFLKIAYAWQL